MYLPLSQVRLLFVPSDGQEDSEDEDEDDEVAHWTHAGKPSYQLSLPGRPSKRVIASLNA